MASSPSSCLGHLPVITVNSQTISSTWSVLEEAITKADYIALDLVSSIANFLLAGLALCDQWAIACRTSLLEHILSYILLNLFFS